ncbi:MAG: GGDEF domain-containing protein [archaeon]
MKGLRRENKKILNPKFKEKVDKILDEIKNSLFDLYDVAIRDEKTGIYNYRFFKNIFEMEIEKAKRGKQKLSLVIIDIDFFKKFNDAHGHLVGDEILVELAKTLSGVLRKYDILARFGGEEFFVLLPSTSLSRAKRVAERLRLSLFKNKKLKKYKVTISLGVSEYRAKDSIAKMIKRADKALYVAKKSGRNRVGVL